jgi:hypothetical protein
VRTFIVRSTSLKAGSFDLLFELCAFGGENSSEVAAERKGVDLLKDRVIPESLNKTVIDAPNHSRRVLTAIADEYLVRTFSFELTLSRTHSLETEAANVLMISVAPDLANGPYPRSAGLVKRT